MKKKKKAARYIIQVFDSNQRARIIHDLSFSSLERVFRALKRAFNTSLHRGRYNDSRCKLIGNGIFILNENSPGNSVF